MKEFAWLALLVVVSSLSPALFWQDKAEARRWKKNVTGIRQGGGREGGKKVARQGGQESGTFSRASCLKAAFVRDSRCRWRGKRPCFLLIFPRYGSKYKRVGCHSIDLAVFEGEGKEPGGGVAPCQVPRLTWFTRGSGNLTR